ncbi:MAG TPA: tetratricopeptide repeat-containing sensor histidine kinase [Fulvivirga sp.]|nr:tetratricopeptide repeat-containing sensor histidine kinase [Fulvivirga sp.]
MKSIFWLCLIFFPTLLFSQSPSQDTTKTYADRGYDLMDTNPDSSLYYLNLAVTQAKNLKDADAFYDAIFGKTKLFNLLSNADSSNYFEQLLVDSAYKNEASPKMKIKIFYRCGDFLKNKNEFVQALNMLDSASHLAIEISDSLFYADILNKKGSVYENMGRRSQALEEYLKALDIYELFKDESMYGIIINNIAISYKKAGDFDNAMLYYNKSIELQMEHDDPGGEAVTRVNRGLLYKDMGEYEKALTDLRFSLVHFEREKYNYGIAVCMHNLGEIFLASSELDSALVYFNKSQQLSSGFEYGRLQIKNTLALAKLERQKRNYINSNKYGLIAYQLASERNLVEDLREINLILSDNYSDQGNFKKGLQHYKEFKQTEDSLFSEESQSKLNLLRTEYDLKYKDNEIAALEGKSKLQTTLAAERQKANVLLTIGILTIVVFFGIVLYLYQRQLKLSKKLSGQKSILIEQKEEIEAAQDKIISQNENLVNLNKEKDNLMAIVSHDLRSPLNQIRGVLGLMKMDSDPKVLHQYIDIANQSAEVLIERINRILDVEAINSGKVDLKIQKLDTKKVLELLEQNFLNAAKQKNMNLRVQSEANVSCMADENYLLQVLENLCSNAIKYSPSKSEIKISVSSEDKNVLFSVKDQGPGITDNEKVKLFLPYSRTSNRPTGDEKSTGLGLSIVKKYVEAMNGEVWVESSNEEGSTFYIKIPRAA